VGGQVAEVITKALNEDLDGGFRRGALFGLVLCQFSLAFLLTALFFGLTGRLGTAPARRQLRFSIASCAYNLSFAICAFISAAPGFSPASMRRRIASVIGSAARDDSASNPSAQF
jgi:hypothetical protein